mmetsp:Transcript_117140/g.343165  ORF Transcript_117140/g.343165 Transcript_117140/m.343165 type:complete len:80 (+) Transcript_117140:218-457(+)
MRCTSLQQNTKMPTMRLRFRTNSIKWSGVGEAKQPSSSTREWRWQQLRVLLAVRRLSTHSPDELPAVCGLSVEGDEQFD